MEFGTKEISMIVEQVLKNLEENNLISTKKTSNSGLYSDKGDYGVFERVEDAIDAAYEAQKIYLDNFKIKDRQRLIAAIRKVSIENAETLARMIVEESKMGRVEDKVKKHLAVIENTPGPECLTTDAITGDGGLMIEEYAPFGLIGAITPVTNPTETIINNTISMISGGNGIVFNVHPSAKKVCAYCLQFINKTIIENGGPANLITMVKEPTMETCNIITQSPKVRLMVGTGGMGMVNSLLRSGKKTIGAGAGNPPVIVDETADIKKAAKDIYYGASFDNNLLCLAEKEVFVLEEVANDFIYNMVDEGAFLLNGAQLEAITNLVLKYENGKYDINKKWVGQDAGKMLEAIGITGKSDTRLLICDVPYDNPFVLLEQLMPVLPIVRCKNLNQAIDYAMIAESGNRHTASMFSKNVDNMTRFARKIETTIFVKNGCTLEGVGIGGEGYTTMTIAGPTGEGITCAKSFTRRRRCMLADGGLRII
ncbi:aldehyde dehydrogenase EutE [Anaerocolumna aminovalerica]|uniref:Propionaldehyde dehydrogenase n=1 Tax=Anaerocolumna aminovalerica TaxID=1527 RepID=A0A1I5J1V5_9FIRM|nr:aldehyde dehydrogenase family protein [Anaerocolumna aminovalerica]MBU5331998.1 aldehyde dehydrogenase EutE [Anaerocolumna aminovalerica]MDU6266523.1 aldehyde dehydrogenase EutE [Anaerocolumna aminovalerica]SFO66623.1 propionaldehyde dehydrogenase [Anaerocolumna aminovalerica]